MHKYFGCSVPTFVYMYSSDFLSEWLSTASSLYLLLLLSALFSTWFFCINCRLHGGQNPTQWNTNVLNPRTIPKTRFCFKVRDIPVLLRQQRVMKRRHSQWESQRKNLKPSSDYEKHRKKSIDTYHIVKARVFVFERLDAIM